MTITSEQRKSINKTNRSRAQSQENWAANYLGLKRVPQSGGGWSKGDVSGELPNDAGKLLLECKMSSAIHPVHGKSVKIDFSWFPKLQKEVEQMGALFGVILLHFHNQSRTDMPVFMRVEDVPLLEQVSGKPFYFSRLGQEFILGFDARGKVLKSADIYHKQLFQGTQYHMVVLPTGAYLVMRIEDFRAALLG